MSDFDATEILSKDRPKKCKCGRPMRWVVTKNGKAMPIDPDPVPNGNVVFAEGSDTDALYVKPGQREFGDERPRYVSHFATCQYARDFRKRHPAPGEAKHDE